MMGNLEESGALGADVTATDRVLAIRLQSDDLSVPIALDRETTRCFADPAIRTHRPPEHTMLGGPTGPRSVRWASGADARALVDGRSQRSAHHLHDAVVE